MSNYYHVKRMKLSLACIFVGELCFYGVRHVAGSLCVIFACYLYAILICPS